MRSKQRTISVKSAEYAGGHKLQLVFSDGAVRLLGFGPFLRASQHPDIRKFLNQRRFRQFAVENGELMWGDFDLIFPIMDL